MTPRLALIARDPEDLEVVSSLLQDAIVQVGEMTYIRDEAAVRPDREPLPPRPGSRRRRISAGRLRKGELRAPLRPGELAVKRRNLDPARLSRVLSLLAIRCEGEYIDLIFSGDHAIRLVADEIACRIDDLDLGWPTRLKPDHPES